MTLHDAVLSSGLPPEAVDIELTETRELGAERVAHDSVATLRSLGYRVVLDDFGSGWSSLDWVMRLPVAVHRLPVCGPWLAADL